MAKQRLRAASPELTHPAPTPLSRWEDTHWRYEHSTPGQAAKSATIDWNFKLDDERSFLEDGSKKLLQELRVFVDTWHKEPALGRPLGSGSAASVAIALSALVRWMESEALQSVGEITEDLSWAFVDWMLAHYEEVGKRDTHTSRKLTHSSAIRAVSVVSKMYQQRTQMRARGVAAVPELPFATTSGDANVAMSPFRVVRQAMLLPRQGKLSPVPDEVALPVLSSAIRMLGVPADDVMNLQDLVLQHEASRVTHYARRKLIGLAYGFTFSRLAGESEPWHGSLKEMLPREALDGRVGMLTASQRVRRLIQSISSACVVVLQGLTGLRAHELVGLTCESIASDWTPSCVVSRLSSDRRMEIFSLRGSTHKGGKKPVEWVIGARPMGSDYEPPPLRALRVLGRLLAPWRTRGSARALIVTFSAARGLPRESSSVGSTNACTLTVWQKEFVKEHVDLSHIPPEFYQHYVERHGIRGHQWRTTFAIFLFRVRSNLVPEIALHFKHSSPLMTERSYIGNDPSLLDAVDSARVQFTAEVLSAMTDAREPLAGAGAKLAKKYSQELATSIGSQRGDSEKAERFVRTHDLELWNWSHGTCLMALMPMKSRCRQMTGSASWRSVQPDFSVRTPELCSGCECLIVRPEHESFWRTRLEDSEAVLAAAAIAGRESEFRIVADRAKLARTFLRALNPSMSVSQEEKVG